MKKILILLLLFTFIVRLWQTTGCRSFLPVKFDPQIVKIKVEEQVNIDKDVNREVSRFFHNKATVGFFEITKSTVKTFDPMVLLDILGPLGLFLLISSLVVLVKNFTRLSAAHFLIVLLTVISTIFLKNSKMSFYILALSLYSFSVWGVNLVQINKQSFSANKITIIGFLLLTIISLWYFAFSWQITSICNEIFFN